MNPQTTDDPDGSDPEIETVTVEVSNTQLYLAIDPDRVARLVRDVLEGEAITDACLSIAVVDDATIRALNRRFLDHDWPTDVITFPLSGPDEPTLSGELIVSAEMAAVTARESAAAPWDELSLYLVHGLLHLCGYDDRLDDDRDAMRQREGEILARLGLTNTFSAVAASIAVADGGVRESARWTV